MVTDCDDGVQEIYTLFLYFPVISSYYVTGMIKKLKLYLLKML